ncbi:MAG: glycosyltransferase family 2 protein [Eubacteriales bacterium]
MLNGKKVAVVVPAYNEETQIGIVIDTMPDFVDRIIIVNDGSSDGTEAIVKEYIAKQKKSDIVIDLPSEDFERTIFNRALETVLQIREEEAKCFPKHEIYNDNNSDRIVLINQENSKVGGAIATGYKWARDRMIDCTAVMAGDAQMDPAELSSICMPVVNEEVDYVKGNRLIHKSARVLIPKKRFFGNSVLSALTKVASGYWRVSDTQTGYTAISLSALESIEIHNIYRDYGMPNDMLVKLNMSYCTVKEIPIKPVYDVGEQSKMRIMKVIPKISWLLLKSFVKRLWGKYFLRDFHPLFLFYNFSFLLGFLNIYFLVEIIVAFARNMPISVGTYLGFVLLTISSLQALFFGMFMDIQDNAKLEK